MNEPTNLPQKVKRLDGTIEVPRRICVDQYTPTERAISAAIAAVERAGASLHLTDAVMLLAKAREKVADHVEGLPESASVQQPVAGPAPKLPTGQVWLLISRAFDKAIALDKSAQTYEGLSASLDAMARDLDDEIQKLYAGEARPARVTDAEVDKRRCQACGHDIRNHSEMNAGVCDFLLSPQRGDECECPEFIPHASARCPICGRDTPHSHDPAALGRGTSDA